MVSEDEYLERIVAGIQTLTTSGSGAEVNWNEKIDNRQFDVVVRFQLGTMRFLVLIEVKNRTRKAEAKDIDAFVNNARDRRCNKIVFVTAAGYQQGAIDVAKRHGVELFTVTFDDTKVELPDSTTFLNLTKKGHENVAPEFSLGDRTPVTAIVSAALLYADGSVHRIPSDPSQMTYYMGKTRLQDGRLLDAVVRNGQLPHPGIKQKMLHRISVQPSQSITPPDEYFFPAGHIVGIDCTLEGNYGRPLRGNVMIDPGLFTAPVVYTNAFTGEAKSFPIHMLPLGEKRVTQGRFYFIDHPLRYFYCAAVRGRQVSWKLVEAFQNGELFRVNFRQDVKYSCFYIPVANSKITKRLKVRLKVWDALNVATRKAS